MIDGSAVLLLATGAAGMFGWFFAWRARGEAGEIRQKLAEAVAGETSARDVALVNGQRAVLAESLAGAERSRADELALQLASERKTRQDLIDALAKAGAPVGPVVVDSAVDRLYANGDKGGQGPDAGAGGDPARVPGQPADAAGSPRKS